MKSLFSHNKGIGLIEILITMGVLAVGILGVAALNSVITRQSQDNKAQAEALAIAQTRIEDARNYTNGVATLADFDERYPDTDGFEDGAGILFNRFSTDFTRNESVLTEGEDKSFSVLVTWEDSAGRLQEVQLDTRLSFIPPQTLGYMANNVAPELVNAPTGRAKIGEGTLDGNEEEVGDGTNPDLTKEYIDGEDRLLAVGNQVVLTLVNACQTENGCDEFVKISGRVFINTTRTEPDPKDIFLVASDAAYCSRYYVDSSGVTHSVSSTTTAANTSLTGYNYFNYTCYLGGGWHGNVGIIFAKTANSGNKYQICMGDPLSVNAKLDPIIGARRAYRGMLYKKDVNSIDGMEHYNGMVRYYSVGIGDGVVLPGAGQASHDFVIGDIDDVGDCATSDGMKASGSSINGQLGALFASVPVDFVCLNDGYIDAFDPTVFGVPTDPVTGTPYCPFDATNPPSERHEISGIVRFTAVDTLVNQALGDGIVVSTSDGPGNCRGTGDSGLLEFTHNGTWYEAPYSCGVYDWGDGWTGYIGLTYDSANMKCSPNKLSFTALGDSDATGNDFNNCLPGKSTIFKGTASQIGPDNGGGAGNRKLISAQISGGGTCEPIAADGLSFTCTTALFPTTWTGTITLTADGNGGSEAMICKETNTQTQTNLTMQVFTFTNQAAGDATVSPVRISRNDASGC